MLLRYKTNKKNVNNNRVQLFGFESICTQQSIYLLRKRDTWREHLTTLLVATYYIFIS